MPHPGISLGRELGAIAQAPFFREPFSGFFEPRKAFREKTPRGYRKGTDSPLARTTLFQVRFAHPKKRARKKKNLNRMYMRDMPKAYPLSGNLGR
jgi:hypothetical protein